MKTINFHKYQESKWYWTKLHDRQVQKTLKRLKSLSIYYVISAKRVTAVCVIYFAFFLANVIKFLAPNVNVKLGLSWKRYHWLENYTNALPFKDQAQTALFKDPVRTAQ